MNTQIPKRIDGTWDLAFKKTFSSIGNEDIIAGLANDFFGFEPKGIVIGSPYNITLYQKQLEESGGDYNILKHTLNDVRIGMANGGLVAEMQVKKQRVFGARSVHYMCEGFCSNYNINGNAYDDLKTMYSLNILKESCFAIKDLSVRSFRMYDIDEMIPMNQEYLAIAYFELLKPRVKNRHQEVWRKYFLGEALPSDAPEYIRRAARIIEVSNLSKEELHMLSLEEKYRADQMASHATARLDGLDAGIEIGRIEGIEMGRVEGREEGLVEVARNMRAEGDSIERVVRITGLSEAIVATL